MSESSKLLSQDDGEVEELFDLPSRQSSKPFRCINSSVHIFMLYLINITLLTIIFLKSGKSALDPSLMLYSPANSAIEYEVKTIAGGFAKSHIKTSYFGRPDNDTDRLWEDLYQNGISLVSKEEADLLPQSTASVQGYPGEYVILLSVFHELHCLNKIRKSLYPEIYGPIIFPDGTKDAKMMGHLDHCVDLLRQTVMCKADTSVGFFARTEEGLLPQSDVMRVCRKFDKIQDWARDHHAKIPVT